MAARNDVAPLDDLAASTCLSRRAAKLEALASYCTALKTFDDAARLNIFTHEHIRLGTLARLRRAYKPCGAGGGILALVFPTTLMLWQYFDNGL